MKTGRRNSRTARFGILLLVVGRVWSSEGADDDCSDEQERREDNHDMERSSKAHRLISRYLYVAGVYPGSGR